MAYLNREQTIKQWAGLVTETQVNNLKQIQQVQFTSRLLINLDPDYFQKAISSHPEGMTFSQLFSQISQYYSKQIGTNIQQIMGEDANIYSTSSIQQIWQLILGIAIKGRNRQKNINIILKMRPQTQQELMRIISKLINRLGENVSVIENAASQIISPIANVSSKDSDLIMELSQQNEQLKQKIEELTTQVTSLKDRNKILKTEIDERNLQRKQIINLMVRQPISSKFSSSGSTQSNTDIITQFIKDVLSQINTLTKQLNKKQQKLQYFEEVNRDLKIAYTTIDLQLQHMKNSVNSNNIDVIQIQKQIEELRSENLDYAQRQKDLLSKIGDLEEQKFYLKGIVQRLQTKNNISQQKIQQVILAKKIVPSQLLGQQQKQSHIKKQKETDSFIFQPSSVPSKVANLNTVRKQIDETNQPSLKNKFQREVSHLQKKVNSLQQQNNSLKKINLILQKVINDFTKQSSEIMQKYESSIEPLFRQFQQMQKQQQKKRQNLQQQSARIQVQNQKKINELMQKIKQKMGEYDTRQIEYQKTIRVLQLERDQLLKLKQGYQQKQSMAMPTIIIEKPKINKNFESSKIQLTIEPTQKKTQKQEIQKSQKAQENINKQPIQQQKIQKKQKTDVIKQGQQKQCQVKKKGALEISKMTTSPNIAASIIVQDEEEELQGRRRQYSFMANRQSSYHFGGEGELGFKQKTGNINRISSLGSCIEQEVNLRSHIENGEPEAIEHQMGSLGHVDIIDITQIEQQLAKIKQHYMMISQQGEQLCKQLLNKQDKNSKKTSQNIVNIIKKYEQQSEDAKQCNKGQLQKYLKDIQSAGLDKAKITAQNIRIKQENAALRKHLIALSKQRKSIEERLNFLQKQSSKNNDEKTKQELCRLSSSINQIRAVMAESQGMYLQLEDYMQECLGGGEKQIGALIAEVKQLSQALKQRQYAIAQLEAQSALLVGAVLEFRNSSFGHF